ncbi:MAG: coproporphyrinogen III oxidase family protein [Treponema sp.]|jgi:oxygen-independent coproporphyrinogen-3 oxidase|nr:coproporphyrinogen III oxidase family protein [Treponema sp.]
MYAERFRTHHDAESRLTSALNPDAGRERSGAGRRDRQGELEEWLRGNPEEPVRDAGVYIHVPWCDTLCSFCNLNRKAAGSMDGEAYTAGIVGEIQRWGASPALQKQRFAAIYLGGGTPTVLSTAQLTAIIHALKDRLPLAADCEISVETTLHNLSPPKAAALLQAGVNRLSLGIQTFSDRGRKLLGRSYGEKQSVERLKSLRGNFDGALCVDLIYSYPGETIGEAKRDAELVLATGVDSVSFYSLMLNEGSFLSCQIRDGKVAMDRSLESEKALHHLLYDTLGGAGFSLLELTKLALPGRDRYRYIQVQYERGDLLPLGPGAGGRLGKFSLYNTASGSVVVSERKAAHEPYYRMLGQLELARYDPALLCADLNAAETVSTLRCLASLAERGLLEPDENGACRATRDGVFWGNNMAWEILAAALRAGPGDDASTATAGGGAYAKNR